MRPKILNFIYLLTAFLFHLNDTKPACFNADLEQLNCDCPELDLASDQCLNGISELSCSFRNTTSVNQIDEVWMILNEMNELCWTGFKFENVHQLNSYSILKLALFNSGEIPFKLKNVQAIRANAFKSMSLCYNDLKLAIEIDSQTVAMEKQAFSFIQAKLIKFINNEHLWLTTSLFENSVIDTIQIEYSNLINFTLDSNCETIQNLVLDACFIETLMNSSARLSGFKQMKNIQIKNSGITSLKANLFAECCKNLNQLRLDNNLLSSIEIYSLKGLNSLKYLDLSRNPIKFIDSQAFTSFKHTLKRLNLNRIKVESFDSLLDNMTSLEEITLAQSSINILWPRLNQIKYLDLSNSELVVTANNLNSILDTVNSSTNQLFYLNVIGNYLDDATFYASHDAYKMGLWYNLRNTFVHLNQDHECSCAMFYLYVNISRFNFPLVDSESTEEALLHKYVNLTGNQLDNRTLWENTVLPLMPKCYRKLWLQTFSMEKIDEKISECNFNSSTTTKLFSSTSTRHHEPKTKIIYSEYSIPVIGTVFMLTFVVIILLIIKAKYDHRRRFLQIFRNNFDHLTNGPKQLNNLSSRLSFNVYSFDPRHITQ